MGFGYVIRYSYVSALQIMGSELTLDDTTLARLEQNRIDRARYLGPTEIDPQDGQKFRRYVDSVEKAGKWLDVNQAIDYAQNAYHRAPSTERGLTIEVVGLEDNYVYWKGKKPT